MSEDYPNPLHQQLIKAFSSLKNKAEIQAFLRDLLTISEINEVSQRFEIAKLLWLGGKSYQEIADTLKVSTTTVTRVADWLYNKNLNGYQTALNRLYPKSKPPKKPAKSSLKVFPR